MLDFFITAILPQHKQNHVEAAVVAQAVEQHFSVRAGQVRIPGRPWLFRQTVSILAGRWAFSINRVLYHAMRDTSILLSCFLSSLSIIVCQSINCNQCTKREINPKRGRERPIFKKKVEYSAKFGEKSKFVASPFLMFCRAQVAHIGRKRGKIRQTDT